MVKPRDLALTVLNPGTAVPRSLSKVITEARDRTERAISPEPKNWTTAEDHRNMMKQPGSPSISERRI